MAPSPAAATPTAKASPFGQAFQESLTELVNNDREVIKHFRNLAAENKQEAVNVTMAIYNHLHQCPSGGRLPALYLADSIMKLVGEPYMCLISQVLQAMFAFTWDRADSETRASLHKLCTTWRGLIPQDVQLALEEKVRLAALPQPAPQVLVVPAAGGAGGGVVGTEVPAAVALLPPHLVAIPGVPAGAGAAALTTEVAPLAPLRLSQPQQHLLPQQRPTPQHLVLKQHLTTVALHQQLRPLHTQQQQQHSQVVGHSTLVSGHQQLAAPVPPCSVHLVPPHVAPAPAPHAVLVPPPAPHPAGVAAGACGLPYPRSHIPPGIGAATPAWGSYPLEPAVLAPAMPPIGAAGLGILPAAACTAILQPPPSPNPLHALDGNFRNNLKAFHPSALEALSANSQCTRRRFLDVEFHRTKQRKTAAPAGGSGAGSLGPGAGQRSQRWYGSVGDWLTGTSSETMQEGENGAGIFEECEEHDAAGLVHYVEEDPSQPECAISGEPFEKVYDPDQDKWQYKDAILLGADDAARYGVMSGSIVKVHSLASGTSTSGVSAAMTVNKQHQEAKRLAGAAADRAGGDDGRDAKRIKL